ncbi:unnamed protein product [Acanthoscelides obtectus]|nr:unnamed protein product [Acanthoscelides obtectus]CAK1663344.1 hypothetical protein AOBTE_LOCUS23620 [Acanthoscelides obtectus]
MQVLAHLTELMKYDLKPSSSSPESQNVGLQNLHPTPPHKPAIYAPFPAPARHFFKRDTSGIFGRDLDLTGDFDYLELDKFFRSTPFAENFFFDTLDPTLDLVDDLKVNNGSSSKIEQYLGKNFADVWKLANKPEPDGVVYNVNAQVFEFLREYDEWSLRKKQTPPTKAYVTLLSLYDLLNKDSKKLGLNKYQGYHDRVLKDLSDSSSRTSAYQLKRVLSKVLERRDTKREDIMKKMMMIISDLDEHNSYLNMALKYIPPLAFAL